MEGVPNSALSSIERKPILSLLSKPLGLNHKLVKFATGTSDGLTGILHAIRNKKRLCWEHGAWNSSDGS